MTPPSNNDHLQELYKDVVKLKTDVAQVDVLVDRLDKTIEKLTEVSKNISELLAVQGSRLDFQEKIIFQMSQLLERTKNEVGETFVDVKRDLTTVEKEIYAAIDKKHDELIERVQELRESNTKSHNSINEKLTTLEKWMWLVTGGAGIIAYVISKLTVSLKVIS